MDGMLVTGGIHMQAAACAARQDDTPQRPNMISSGKYRPLPARRDMGWRRLNHSRVNVQTLRYRHVRSTAFGSAAWHTARFNPMREGWAPSRNSRMRGQPGRWRETRYRVSVESGT
jgi:hypothetical protein